MRITIVGWAYDGDLQDEDALLERYATLTGWCDALREAGATSVSVVHRFHRDAVVHRDHVEYRFCRDASGPHPSAWTGSTALAATVCASKPDVVHVNGLGFPMQTWRLRQRVPPATALVVQDHANGPPRPFTGAWTGRMRYAVRRRAMRAPDGFFFASLAQAQPWLAHGLIGSGQRVCAVGEASTRLRPLCIEDARRMTGGAGRPAILWVGRLNANKDPLCVVEAFAEMLHTFPMAVLTMLFGSDELLGAVRQRIEADRRLAAAVRLVGRVPHLLMASYYSAADLFVLGSHHEGSGYALIEACACGLSPAVTDIPPFRTLTGGGHIGRLWPVGDARACARALTELAADVGPSQRAVVRGHFQRALSWPAVARQAMAAYAQIARDRHRVRPGRGEAWPA